MTRGPVPVTTPVDGYVLRSEVAVNAKDYGAIGNGVVDDTAALQAALTAAAGRELRIPYGTYKYTDVLTVPSDTRIDARGAKFTPSGFNASTIRFDSPSAFYPATPLPLTANSAVATYTVTVSLADAATLAADDVVSITDPTYMLGGFAIRREANIVRSVNAGTGVVTLKFPLGHPYTTANVCAMGKVTPARDIHWRGGYWDMSGIVGGISADCDVFLPICALDCSIADVTAVAWPDKIVSWANAVNCRTENISGFGPSLVGPGEGYVTQLYACRNSVLAGGFSRNVRHHHDITGGQGNKAQGGMSVGRTTDYNTGVHTHGWEGRWNTLGPFTAINMSYAALVGNGTFGGDYETEVVDVQGYHCDRTHYADMDSTVRFVGGVAMINDGAAGAPCLAAGTASATFENIQFRGTALRGVYSTSTGHTKVIGCDFGAATIGEAVRADAGKLTVAGGCVFSATSGGVRAATSCTHVALGSNAWHDVSARLTNTSTAIVLGTSTQETESTAAPTTGTWKRGDRCWNTTPSASGVPGWICVTAGTPGTWKAMGALAA